MSWAEYIRGNVKHRVPVRYVEAEVESEEEIVDVPAEKSEPEGPGPEPDDMTGSYLRLAADFDNFRRRTTEISGRENSRQKREFILELLEVVDDFDLALVQDSSGLEPIYRHLTALLDKHGIERIKTVGERFDPALHEAVMVDRHVDMPEGCVSRELRGGYTMISELLRPARVAVVKRG